MRHHALGMTLHTPIILCEKPAKEIVVLKVICNDGEVTRQIKFSFHGAVDCDIIEALNYIK